MRNRFVQGAGRFLAGEDGPVGDGSAIGVAARIGAFEARVELGGQGPTVGLAAFLPLEQEARRIGLETS